MIQACYLNFVADIVRTRLQLDVGMEFTALPNVIAVLPDRIDNVAIWASIAGVRRLDVEYVTDNLWRPG